MKCVNLVGVYRESFLYKSWCFVRMWEFCNKVLVISYSCNIGRGGRGVVKLLDLFFVNLLRRGSVFYLRR